MNFTAEKRGRGRVWLKEGGIVLRSLTPKQVRQIHQALPCDDPDCPCYLRGQEQAPRPDPEH